MKFWEAVKALEEGKKVRIKDWPLDKYIQSDATVGLFWALGREWELYEEPVQLYSFIDVVKGMRNGKKYRRQHLWISGEYIQQCAGRIIDENGQCTELLLEDYEAKDWIEVK